MKQTIKFTKQELKEIECGEAPIGFDWVDKIIAYVDPEDNYIRYVIILKRILDNKFFGGTYESCSGGVEWEGDFEQVFPKQVTTTIYE